MNRHFSTVHQLFLCCVLFLLYLIIMRQFGLKSEVARSEKNSLLSYTSLYQIVREIDVVFLFLRWLSVAVYCCCRTQYIYMYIWHPSSSSIQNHSLPQYISVCLDHRIEMILPFVEELCETRLKCILLWIKESLSKSEVWCLQKPFVK